MIRRPIGQDHAVSLNYFVMAMRQPELGWGSGGAGKPDGQSTPVSVIGAAMASLVTCAGSRNERRNDP